MRSQLAASAPGNPTYLAEIELNATHSHPVVNCPASQVAFVDLKLASSV
jgi:hypothetical protein